MMSYVVTVQCRSRTAGRHAHAGRPRRPQLTQGDCINISTFLVFSAVGASLQQPAVGVTTSEYGVFVHDARPPLIGGRRLTGSLLLGILAISGACFLLLVFLVSLPFIRTPFFCEFICTPLGCSTFYPLHSKLEVILFFKFYYTSTRYGIYMCKIIFMNLK
jgi:hypothetical protein